MASSVETKIYRVSAVCAFLATLSLIIPRFVSNPEGGFAAAAGAVLVLLAILLIAVLVSIYLAVITVRDYRNICPMARVFGIAPALLLSGLLVGLFVFLQY